MNSNYKITIWLFITSFFVFLMIVVGGYTRLTHSGLSITEWKPISGIVPPLNENSWNEEFSNYQNSPEFKQVNSKMNLLEFKQIFWVEYIHRLLGRLTGLIFLVPLLFFWRNFKFKEKIYFATVLTLIALQGLMGWLMVKSGLVNMPSVSQYRLALHLSLACIILVLLVWKTIPGTIVKYKYGYFSIFILSLQIFSGAIVAGLRAGLVYNSFPLMNGEFIPEGLFILQPFYLNFFENVTCVQFFHRILGLINVINLLAYSWKIFTLYVMKKNAILLAAITFLQLTLGIITIIFQVPILPALFHQAMAVVLLVVLVASLKKA